jgi:hypothetical protein
MTINTDSDSDVFIKCNLKSLEFYIYSKTCLKRTPYIPETWTNVK